MLVMVLNNGLVYALRASDLKGAEPEAVAMCSRMNRGASIHQGSSEGPQVAGIGWTGDRYRFQIVGADHE